VCIGSKTSVIFRWIYHLLETERGSTRSHPVENSLTKRLRTYRKTDYRMMTSFVMQLAVPKHVAGIQCVKYTFIHLCAFVGFDICSCSKHGYGSFKGKSVAPDGIRTPVRPAPRIYLCHTRNVLYRKKTSFDKPHMMAKVQKMGSFDIQLYFQ
jgi:hypothetical protein